MVRATKVFQSTFAGLGATFWWLWAGILVNRLAAFVLPFAALYLAGERQLSVESVGTAIAVFGVGCLVATLIGGVLADRWGRRVVIVWSQLIAAVATVVFALSGQAWVLFGSMFVIGAASTAPRPAMAAIVADIIRPADQVRAYSMVHWAYNLGMLAAPLAVALASQIGFTPLLLVDAVATFLFFLIVLSRVPETMPALREAGTVARRRSHLVFTDLTFVCFVLAILVFATLTNQYSITLPLSMTHAGLTPADFGIVLLINAIMVIVLQVPVGRLLNDREPVLPLAVGVALTGIGLGVNAFATSIHVFAAAAVVWTIGELLTTPTSATIVAQLSPADARARYQGLNSVAWSSSSIIAPAAGTATFAAFGPAAVWYGCLVAGLATTAMLLLLRPRITARRAHLSAQPETASRETPAGTGPLAPAVEKAQD